MVMCAVSGCDSSKRDNPPKYNISHVSTTGMFSIVNAMFQIFLQSYIHKTVGKLVTFNHNKTLNIN